jgi:hypothetical protein
MDVVLTELAFDKGILDPPDPGTDKMLVYLPMVKMKDCEYRSMVLGHLQATGAHLGLPHVVVVWVR